MLYLASEIVGYLLGAAAIGFVTGWLIRGGRRPSPDVGVPDEVWRERLELARDERDLAEAQARDAIERVEALEGRLEELEAMDQAVRPRLREGLAVGADAGSGRSAAGAGEASPVPETLQVRPISGGSGPVGEGATHAGSGSGAFGVERDEDLGTAPTHARTATEVEEASVDSLGGIGGDLGNELARLGIRSTRDLLDRLRTPSGRQVFADELDIPLRWVRRWASFADLLRVRGIDEATAQLLEASGVYSIQELARQEAQELIQQMIVVNATQRLAPGVPGTEAVRSWIETARTLPHILEGSRD